MPICKHLSVHSVTSENQFHCTIAFWYMYTNNTDLPRPYCPTASTVSPLSLSTNVTVDHAKREMCSSAAQLRTLISTWLLTAGRSVRSLKNAIQTAKATLVVLHTLEPLCCWSTNPSAQWRDQMSAVVWRNESTYSGLCLAIANPLLGSSHQAILSATQKKDFKSAQPCTATLSGVPQA